MYECFLGIICKLCFIYFVVMLLIVYVLFDKGFLLEIIALYLTFVYFYVSKNGNYKYNPAEYFLKGV